MSAGSPTSRSRTTATATRRRIGHGGLARRAMPSSAFIPPAALDPSAARWRRSVRYPPCQDDLTFPCDIIRCEHSPPR